MSSFEVGEIAIYYRPGHNCHGREVKIISGLSRSELRNSAHRRVGTYEGYEIEMPGMKPPIGCAFVATPEQLRKRRPPQDWAKLCNLDAMPKLAPKELA